MKIAKTNIYRDRALQINDPELKKQLKRADQDMANLFLAMQGRIRFGTGTDGDRGENIAGEFQIVSDTGNANTEFSFTHGLGAVPVGFLVINIDKGGVVYDSGTAWTSTTIYLKCSVANANVKLFLIK